MKSEWLGAYDESGALRATFDSESEAIHYVRGRGHMEGGRIQKVPIADAKRILKLVAILADGVRLTADAIHSMPITTDENVVNLAMWAGRGGPARKALEGQA